MVKFSFVLGLVYGALYLYNGIGGGCFLIFKPVLNCVFLPWMGQLLDATPLPRLLDSFFPSAVLGTTSLCVVYFPNSLP